jgi:hypothetical protein
MFIFKVLNFRTSVATCRLVAKIENLLIETIGIMKIIKIYVIPPAGAILQWLLPLYK